MKNLKKKLYLLAFSLMASCIGFQTVSAGATLTVYNAKLGPQAEADIASITPESNYVYAMNNVQDSEGKAAIHSVYYTVFKGKQVKIGASMKVSSQGKSSKSLWYPSNKSSSLPSYTAHEGCSGENTTANYCAIAGSKYILKLTNENWIDSFTVKNGNFTLFD